MRYEFICEKCQIVVEDDHSITEELRDECPKCGCMDPEIFHQNYSKTLPFMAIENVTTAGQFAERNWRRWGRELTTLKGEAIKNQYTKEAAGKSVCGGKPIGRNPISTEKPLDLSKMNVKRYIEEGRA